MGVGEIEDGSVTGQIKVSSKTLGLISSGIYRSAAGALKELVSNAFDADAEWVRIGTNPPSFDVVSITDSGSGMTFDKFMALMERQIGDSDKRIGNGRTGLKNRPVIGRIGIGLLAIAQICHGFEVVSHHNESRTAFRARIQITDYLPEELDALEIGTDESVPSLGIGEYLATPITFDETQAGTSIIATDLKYGFLKRIRRDVPHMGKDTLLTAIDESIETGPPPLLPDTMEKFFQDAAKHDSLREVSEYWRMVWNIALSSPLPYMPHGPIRHRRVLVERNEELKSFDFRVEVDDLQLLRPVVLPPRESDVRAERDRHVEPLAIDKEVDGSRLKGQGYIYSQGGKSIYPAELRGMLIRIKGVAIGDYDRNFLEYPIVEGPRYSWLSGELDIEEGLEDALNIDRDSFNQSHPHYLEIQGVIHKALDKQVRPWLYRNLTVRKQQREQEAEVKLQATIAESVSHILPNVTTIEHVSVPVPRKEQMDQVIPPVRVDATKDHIEINDSATWPRSRRNRDLAQQIAVGFELALTAATPDEIRRIFYDYLGRILK